MIIGENIIENVLWPKNFWEFLCFPVRKYVNKKSWRNIILHISVLCFSKGFEQNKNMSVTVQRIGEEEEEDEENIRRTLIIMFILLVH